MSPPSERSLRRRRAIYEPRLQLVLYCEGGVTEPRYFVELAAIARNPLVEVHVEGTGFDPRVLVQHAVARKRELTRLARRSGDSFASRFEVWSIFDVDEHAWVAEARQQANDNGVKIAVSNPCFELWCLYHLTDFNAPISRGECQRELASKRVGYTVQNKTFLVSQCAASRDAQIALVRTAIRRAERGLQSRDEEGMPRGSPSSECGSLLRKILLDEEAERAQ